MSVTGSKPPKRARKGEGQQHVGAQDGSAGTAHAAAATPQQTSPGPSAMQPSLQLAAAAAAGSPSSAVTDTLAPATAVSRPPMFAGSVLAAIAPCATAPPGPATTPSASLLLVAAALNTAASQTLAAVPPPAAATAAPRPALPPTTTDPLEMAAQLQTLLEGLPGVDPHLVLGFTLAFPSLGPSLQRYLHQALLLAVRLGDVAAAEALMRRAAG